MQVFNESFFFQCNTHAMKQQQVSDAAWRCYESNLSGLYLCGSCPKVLTTPSLISSDSLTSGILNVSSTVVVQLTKAHSLAGAWHVPDGGHAQAPGAAELALLPCGRRQDRAGAQSVDVSNRCVTWSLAAPKYTCKIFMGELSVSCTGVLLHPGMSPAVPEAAVSGTC